ncbi:hypothetical protein [Halobacillus litoralis]|uniref:hypothetical protein n=1 Tax=Halobacillus litoralis TaxID=45668 RepID=UPI00136D07D9|nr:hypothetical protein [Halobacillus litoralis]MYL37069.1 hypothetical protein [Halobacillus litoralis]
MVAAYTYSSTLRKKKAARAAFVLIVCSVVTVVTALLTGNRSLLYTLPAGVLISGGAVWYVLTMKTRTYTFVRKNGLTIHRGLGGGYLDLPFNDIIRITKVKDVLIIKRKSDHSKELYMGYLSVEDQQSLFSEIEKHWGRSIQ